MADCSGGGWPCPGRARGTRKSLGGTLPRPRDSGWHTGSPVHPPCSPQAYSHSGTSPLRTHEPLLRAHPVTSTLIHVTNLHSSARMCTHIPTHIAEGAASYCLRHGLMVANSKINSNHCKKSMWYIQTLEYYSTRKRNKVLIHATACG